LIFIPNENLVISNKFLTVRNNGKLLAEPKVLIRIQKEVEGKERKR